MIRVPFQKVSLEPPQWQVVETWVNRSSFQVAGISGLDGAYSHGMSRIRLITAIIRRQVTTAS